MSVNDLERMVSKEARYRLAQKAIENATDYVDVTDLRDPSQSKRVPAITDAIAVYEAGVRDTLAALLAACPPDDWVTKRWLDEIIDMVQL